MSSLLQGVLRPSTLPAEGLAAKLNSLSLAQREAKLDTTSNNGSPLRTPSPNSEEDEIVGVQSAPMTPRMSSRGGSRPHSPTRNGAATRRVPGPLLLSSTITVSKQERSGRDPLRVLPTEVSQSIFGLLTIKQLARCARVCKKWNRSQTLNYVWFQTYRKENFQDESLPPGKWTRRESKQNWRVTFIDSRKRADKDNSIGSGRSPYYALNDAINSPSRPGSGYQTPREIREEKWKAEAETAVKPGKVEMREMYKELGGRKAKSKNKFVPTGISRDKGGWENDD